MAATGSASSYSARQALVQILNRRVYSGRRRIRENDVVFIRDAIPDRKSKLVYRSRLTKPITPSSEVHLARGTILGADLIGRRVLDAVPLRTGPSASPITIHEAPLAAYVVHQPRICTPIYPQDAALIVSLLDVNVPVPGEDPEFDAAPPFEIFEAGTGAGSLTLHLARAIHGANPATPPRLRDALCASPYRRYSDMIMSDRDGAAERCRAPDPHPLDLADPALRADLEACLGRRRAVIHTLDREPDHSRAAHTMIRRFRRAQYLLDVAFHLGSVAQHLRARLARTGGAPFLAHALLDLPSPLDEIGAVVDALKPAGLLVVFQPSITQVGAVATWVRETGQPLRLELTIELAEAVDRGRDLMDGTGGREWDMRVVRDKDRDGNRDGRAGPGRSLAVCRPKVGGTISGGGFVAVFRKLVPRGEEA